MSHETVTQALLQHYMTGVGQFRPSEDDKLVWSYWTLSGTLRRTSKDLFCSTKVTQKPHATQCWNYSTREGQGQAENVRADPWQPVWDQDRLHHSKGRNGHSPRLSQRQSISSKVCFFHRGEAAVQMSRIWDCYKEVSNLFSSHIRMNFKYKSINHK